MKRVHIQDYALLALYGVSFLSLLVAAPKVITLLKNVDVDFNKKRNPDYRITQAYKRLRANGLVKEITKKGRPAYVLTRAGESRLERLRALENMTRVLKWDGLWRIVIFDVWERRRSARDRLRSLLSTAGFLCIQGSVWIYPHDCEEFIGLVKTELNLGKGMLYVIAQGIEADSTYREHFHLES